MYKIDVTPGLVWVEIPDADLRIQCGCPADSVKHLMRRGLIRPTTVKGVPCETGPNVILLSDELIQNGSVCNMAEFPVLQMLYRQGLILPNHPNNTGTKPLLVGRSNQVTSQMQYIFRGNYGLISEEEMMAVGVSADDAREMMRLKLRFAFGSIRHPSELLEGVYLNDQPVEVRNGVMVRRCGKNRVEFSYQGQTLMVDLTLPPYQSYECPYPLGAYQFQRDYFSVVHSGEGDGWDIRRPSMGSIVVFQGRVYLVDAGPNLFHTLNSLGIGVNEVEGIFQTHTHDDHFAGMTTLMQADRRVKFYAVPTVRASAVKKMAALLSIEEEDFSRYFDPIDLRMGEWNDVNGLDVQPLYSPHPVETTIFRFRAMSDQGYRVYAHYADIVDLNILKGMVTDDVAKPGLSQSAYDKIRADYLEPADVKKVDIGGGMIHGNALDFRDDPSGKIILAHTSLAFTPEQKRIGSGASFGTVDVLIEGHRDFLARAAYHALRDYFPSVSPDHLGGLLNGPILTFNPETILMKSGQCHDDIYVLLTGQVEVLDDSSEFRAILSAGALLGELTGLHGLPSSETYRAISFVRVMRLSCAHYTAFVTRHSLFSEISHLMEAREFLSKTWLLSGVMSTSVLNAVAKSMTSRTYMAGASLVWREPAVALIGRGRLVRYLADRAVETLSAGDFFGEEYAVFNVPPITILRVEEECEVHLIPADMLASIPNVLWKLFESFDRHIRINVVSDDLTLALPWREEYSINVHHIDVQHKGIFSAANGVVAAMYEGRKSDYIISSLEHLINYTKFHFSSEEAMLRVYSYDHEESHVACHHRLIEQVEEFAQRVRSGETLNTHDVVEFLKGWIVNHILMDDRRYGAFLNKRGVY